MTVGSPFIEVFSKNVGWDKNISTENGGDWAWWVLLVTVLGSSCFKFIAQVARANLFHNWTVPFRKPCGLLLGLGPPFVGPMPT